MKDRLPELITGSISAVIAGALMDFTTAHHLAAVFAVVAAMLLFAVFVEILMP